MTLHESRNIFGDYLRLTFVENPGMAFGINLGMPVVLSLFSLVASGFIIYIIKKTEFTTGAGFKFSLGLILGGALGNFIDRAFYGLIFKYAPLFYGRVVDFVDCDIPDINLFNLNLSRFYVFNIADAAVSVGMVLLFFFYPKEEVIAKQASNNAALEGVTNFANVSNLANEPNQDSDIKSVQTGIDSSAVNEEGNI